MSLLNVVSDSIAEDFSNTIKSRPVAKCQKPLFWLSVLRSDSSSQPSPVVCAKIQLLHYSADII